MCNNTYNIYIYKYNINISIKISDKIAGETPSVSEERSLTSVGHWPVTGKCAANIPTLILRWYFACNLGGFSAHPVEIAKILPRFN